MSEGTDRYISDDGQIVDEHGALLPHLRYDYAGRCWWCGGPADSKEHKHKKSDVKRQFGSGPYAGDNAVVRGVTEKGQLKHYQVQGPDSIQLKFAKVLCGTCNSSRSQKADYAYDAFSEYFARNDKRLLHTARFRWSDIFPQRWRSGRDLVTAYWLKHIGCQLAAGGVRVPAELVAYLDTPGDLRPVPVRMQLEICTDISDVQRDLPPEQRGSFWIGALQCMYSPSQSRVTEATGFYGQRWLLLHFHYNVNMKPGPDAFSRKKVRLPRRRYA